MPPKSFWFGIFAVIVTVGLVLANLYYWNRYKYPPPAVNQTEAASPEASQNIAEYSLSGRIKSVAPTAIVFDYTGTLEQKYAQQEKTFLLSQVTAINIVTSRKDGSIISTPAKFSDLVTGARATLYAPTALMGADSPYLSRIDLIK